MVNQQLSYHTQKSWFSFSLFLSLWLSNTNSLKANFMPDFIICWDFVWLQLFQALSIPSQLHVLTCTTALLCLEDKGFLNQVTSSYSHSAPFCGKIPGPQRKGCDTYILLRAEHSIVSYSLHIYYCGIFRLIVIDSKRFLRSVERGTVLWV